jgi:acetylornithine/succinyldiaminopimelate/putrescine aminotransferase
MNATGLDMWRTDPFPLPGVHHTPFGDLDALRRLLDDRGDRVGTIIGEPVQGNGGINVPPAEFWPQVRAMSDRRCIALVFDEVQTGLSRTGRRFACEHWDVTPDILVISKALGNGFPIAAFVTTDAMAASYRRPGASTYGGNPVCAAAALATIEFHESMDLARNARERGAEFLHGLEILARRHHGTLQAPRGLGLMLGLPCMDAAGYPSAARCDAMLEAIKARGVLAGKTGADRNVLTFMPPLVIQPHEVERALEAIVSAADEIG